MGRSFALVTGSTGRENSEPLDANSATVSGTVVVLLGTSRRASAWQATCSPCSVGGHPAREVPAGERGADVGGGELQLGG